jgi:transposase
MKLCEDERYYYYEVSSSYGGIDQKWIVVYSNESKECRIKTFDKNLKNQEVATLQKLKKLKKIEHECEADARNAADRWIKEQTLFEFDELSIEKKTRRMNGKRGRPRKDEVLKEYYCIKATLKFNEEAVEERRSKCGRFVLGTNDLSLSPDQILSYYKEQGFVEHGFKFIKDKSFHVSEVYLKKPHRIESLSMIMVLCLFLYSFAQWRLRSRLVETGTYVRNQVKKQVQNPTMKWIFFLFRNITEVKVTMGDQSETTVSNMRDELWKILELMGPEFKKYYI